MTAATGGVRAIRETAACASNPTNNGTVGRIAEEA